tara:strand:+ start:225 stop:506 length:282 start_codon:yes stop_codon:yes gene_type:complete
MNRLSSDFKNNRGYAISDNIPKNLNLLSLTILYVDSIKNKIAAVLCINPQSLLLKQAMITNKKAGSFHLWFLCNHNPKDTPIVIIGKTMGIKL